MALVSCSDVSDGTAMSCNRDDSFPNLLRFVDVASSRIRQALDRPRRCRRRVNHRKYLARILYGVDVARNGHISEHRRGHSESTSKPAMSQSDHSSKRRPSKVRTMQSVVREETKSYAVVNRPHYDHFNADDLTSHSELYNDAAVAGYDFLETAQSQFRRPPVSSVYLNNDVSQAQVGDRVTSTVNDEPHHSWFLRRPAARLPQQSQPLSVELAAANSWYQTGFRQPHQCPSAAAMWHIHNEDCSSFVVNQQPLNLPRSDSYRQGLPSACEVDETLNLSSSSSRYAHNQNQFSCSSYWIATPSVVSPFVYNSCKDVFNDDVDLTNLASPTSDFNLPCNTPSATVQLCQTPTTDGHLIDWMALRGETRFVDRPTSPSSFNDSGLGSTSFGSATDIDGSSPTDLFFWPSNYEFCHLASNEAHTRQRLRANAATVW